MRKIKTYEQHQMLSLPADKEKALNVINNISKDFWEMVNVAKWWEVVEGYRKSATYHADYVEWYEQAQARLYIKYDFQEIRSFRYEYEYIYYTIYDYFYSMSDKFSVSDDGYCDLISTIVGRGKDWIIKCINNPNLVKKMGKNDEYMENFGYLLNVEEEDYWDIIQKYDPDNLKLTARKYNL